MTTNIRIERRGLSRRLTEPYFRWVGCSYGREIAIWALVLLLVLWMGHTFHI
jgi:hypothetical protein